MRAVTKQDSIAPKSLLIVPSNGAIPDSKKVANKRMSSTKTTNERSHPTHELVILVPCLEIISNKYFEKGLAKINAPTTEDRLITCLIKPLLIPLTIEIPRSTSSKMSNQCMMVKYKFLCLAG